MDFSQLAVIAAGAGIAGEARHHVRFAISEENVLCPPMQSILHDCNIAQFQYGKGHHQGLAGYRL